MIEKAFVVYWLSLWTVTQEVRVWFPVGTHFYFIFFLVNYYRINLIICLLKWLACHISNFFLTIMCLHDLKVFWRPIKHHLLVIHWCNRVHQLKKFPKRSPIQVLIGSMLLNFTDWTRSLCWLSYSGKGRKLQKNLVYQCNRKNNCFSHLPYSLFRMEGIPFKFFCDISMYQRTI